MRGPNNARHVIDAVKVLDGLASTGGEAAAAGTRFEITINLNGDVEHYSKSIEVNADDVSPSGANMMPQDMIAAFATNKKDDDGGQGHL